MEALNEMSPIDKETVQLLMHNLSINLANQQFREQHAFLLEQYRQVVGKQTNTIDQGQVSERYYIYIPFTFSFSIDVDSNYLLFSSSLMFILIRRVAMKVGKPGQLLSLLQAITVKIANNNNISIPPCRFSFPQISLNQPIIGEMEQS